MHAQGIYERIGSVTSNMLIRMWFTKKNIWANFHNPVECQPVQPNV